MTFPFVASAVEGGDVTLHGLWTNITDGGMEVYDPEADAFLPI
jgi:carbonic anhydrase